MAETDLAATVMVPGHASGRVLVLDDALSFWGGFDAGSGTVIDAHHPQRGEVISGRILVMPGGRGSSSSSSVLAEGIRAGTAPAAIVLPEADEIIVLGALVVKLLDGKSIPVVALDAATFASLATGDEVTIDEAGTIRINS